MIRELLKGFILVPAIVIWWISEGFVIHFQLRDSLNILGQVWVDWHGNLTEFVDPVINIARKDEKAMANTVGTFIATITYMIITLVIIF